MSDTILTPEKKLELRKAIVIEASKLLGIPYLWDGKWTDYSKPPTKLDCSGFVKCVLQMIGLRISDGSQNQYNETILTVSPDIGDLAFFGEDANPCRIYHVGIVYDDSDMIEARKLDPDVSFKTGEVILRPRINWEQYKNFVGYRSHSKLV